MIKETFELLKRPSGKVMAQRQMSDAHRDYIEFMVLSEKHASLSAHYMNEATRVKTQIGWLKEYIKNFDCGDK